MSVSVEYRLEKCLTGNYSKQKDPEKKGGKSVWLHRNFSGSFIVVRSGFPGVGKKPSA